MSKPIGGVALRKSRLKKKHWWKIFNTLLMAGYKVCDKRVGLNEIVYGINPRKENHD